MAPEGGGASESVGSISVDVTAELGPFEEAMKAFDDKVKQYNDKTIKFSLNLEKNFTAKERLVDVTAKWAAETLTGLATKLAARNYVISVSKVTVSQDALNTLRDTLNSLFKSYTGVINVKARVTDIESAGGGPIHLNGPINIESAGPVNETPSASTSRTTGTTSGGSRPAEPTAEPTPTRTRAPRRTAAQRAAEAAAANATFERNQRAQQIVEEHEHRAMARRKAFADWPRYNKAGITAINREIAASEPGSRPAWLQQLADNPKQLRPGAPISKSMMEAVRKRVEFKSTQRSQIRDRDAALDDIFQALDPTGALARARSGELWKAAGAGSDPQGGHTNRMPTAPDLPRIAIKPWATTAPVGLGNQRIDAAELTGWGYQQQRRMVAALRAIDPEFKSQKGESWADALGRAREAEAKAKPAVMGEGVTWDTNIGDTYQATAATHGHETARFEMVQWKNSMRERMGAEPGGAAKFRRKDQLARSIINDIKTGRMSPEEREGLDQVRVGDQDVSDLVSLNQLIGGESKSFTAQEQSRMLPKRSGATVRKMGFDTEAAVMLQKAHDDAVFKNRELAGKAGEADGGKEGRQKAIADAIEREVSGSLTRSEKSRITRAENKVLRGLGLRPPRRANIKDEMFRPGRNTMEGFTPGALEPGVSPELSRGFEMGKGQFSREAIAPEALIERPAYTRDLTAEERSSQERWQKRQLLQSLGNVRTIKEMEDLKEGLNAGPNQEKDPRRRRQLRQQLAMREERVLQWPVVETPRTTVDVPASTLHRLPAAATLGGPVPRGVEAEPKFEQSFEDSALTNTVKFRTTEAGNLKYRAEGDRKWKQAGKARAAAYYRMRGQEQPETTAEPQPETARDAAWQEEYRRATGTAGAGPTPIPTPPSARSERQAEEKKAKGSAAAGGGAIDVRVVNFSEVLFEVEAETALHPAGQEEYRRATGTAGAGPTPIPEPIPIRSERQAEEKKAAASFQELDDQGAEGAPGKKKAKGSAAAGGGAIDVRVVNFHDLNKMLTGEQRGTGSLKRIFKDMDIGEPRREEDRQTLSVDDLKAMGVTPEQLGAAVSGGEVPEALGGKPKKPNIGRRNRRGGTAIQMLDLPKDAVDIKPRYSTADPAAYEAEEQKAMAAAAKQREREVSAVNKAETAATKRVVRGLGADLASQQKQGQARARTEAAAAKAAAKEAAEAANLPFKEASAAAKEEEKAKRRYATYLRQEAKVHAREADRLEREDRKEELANAKEYADSRKGDAEANRTRSIRSTFAREGLAYEKVGVPRAARRQRDPSELAAERALAMTTAAEFPQRAASVAVGQMLSSAIGFKSRWQKANIELQERNRQLRATMGDQDSARGDFEAASSNRQAYNEAHRGETLSKSQLKTVRELRQEYVRTGRALQDIDKTLVRQTEEVQAQKEVVEKAAGLPEKIGSVAALFAGAKLFTIALGAASAGFGMLEKAGGKAIDEMMGFSATSTAVTNHLGQQTKALHGNTAAVYGAAAASAGLSDAAAEYVKNQTVATALAKAGATAQGETSELFRASVGANRGMETKGLYGGYGGFLNGSFLGSELGGGKGLLETVVGDLKYFTTQQEKAGRTPSFVQALPNDPLEALGRLLPWNLQQGVNITEQPTLTGAPSVTPEVGRDFGEARSKYLGDLNAAVDRGRRYRAEDGPKYSFDVVPTKFDEQGKRVGATDAATKDLQAFGQVVQTLTGEARTQADAYMATGGVIRNFAGEVVDGADQIQAAMQDLAAGKTTATPQQVYQQQSWQLRAQLQSQEAQYRYQMDNRIPGSWGQGLATNRLQAVSGPGTAMSQQLRGVTPDARGTIGAGAAQAQEQRAGIQAQADQYFSDMVAKAQAQLRSGNNAAGADALGASLKNVLSLSKEIQAVSQKISFVSAAQQADEFANSIRLAKRAVQDAKGLAGQGGSALGGIQRQQWQLGRESTALSLGMSERQINFQQAVAGFQAPGLTSEERAARMEQAKLEADYARKQLNIQKEQFKLAGKEFGITTGRAVVDALRSLKLLESGRDRAAEMAALTAALENLQAEQSLEVAKLNEGLSAADNIFQTKLGIAASAAATLGIALDDATKALEGFMKTLGYQPVPTPGTEAATGHAKGKGPTKTDDLIDAAQKSMRQTGKLLDEVEKRRAKATRGVSKATAEMTASLVTWTMAAIDMWRRYFAEVTKSTKSYNEAYGGSTGGGGGGDSKVKSEDLTGTGVASGALFTTTGQANLTVGEAGNETVAVLRNPRNVSATGMGGGGGTVIIQINNPSVRNDGDITAIAREVEKVLNRKASLIGLRSIG